MLRSAGSKPLADVAAADVDSIRRLRGEVMAVLVVMGGNCGELSQESGRRRRPRTPEHRPEERGGTSAGASIASAARVVRPQDSSTADFRREGEGFYQGHAAALVLDDGVVVVAHVARAQERCRRGDRHHAGSRGEDR